MSKSIIEEKSFEFSKKIVNIYLSISKTKNEYVLSKQLLRAGTSIGANIVEAECSISKKEFLSKMYISYKECNETKYWLKLLYSAGYLTEDELNDLLKDCLELIKILSSITKTTREQLSKF